LRARLRTRLRTRLRYLTASGTLRRRLLWSAGGLIVLGVVWILITGYLARQQAAKVAEKLQQAKAFVASGQLDRAREVAKDVPGLTRQADLLTSGPAWWIAAHVPYFGRPFEIVRGMTATGEDVGSDGLSQLLDVARILDPAELRLAGDRVDIAAIGRATPRLHHAVQVLDRAAARLAALPAHSWLPLVDGPRAALAAELRGLRGYVAAAARAGDVLPTMLGGDGMRRYFVGLQGEAELRGTGGLPGAFAIVVVDHGTVHFTHFGSDAELLPAVTGQLIDTGLDFGPQFRAAYGYADPTEFIVNSDMSPHFPYAARTWAAMWTKMSGERVDGAIALDSTVLAYFLSVTGPVTLPDGMHIDAANVVPLTENQQYFLFPDYFQRKQFVVDVLHATSDKLTSGAGGTAQLARLVSLAAKQQRFLVWTRDNAVQRLLQQTSYAGVLPGGDRPLVAPVLNNVAGGKLDFYLTRSLDYHRSGCGPTRDVTVTLSLKNNAPASGLPPYVAGRGDHDKPAGAKPGDSRTMLDYYATPGAQLLSVTLNGIPTTSTGLRDRGHPIFRVDLELPRGTTQTVVLHLLEPAGSGEPIIWRQPGVTPLAVQAYSQRCG
jgi:hypothetical protein